MAKHRTDSIEFKRQVLQEYLSGETLAYYRCGADRRTGLRAILIAERLARRWPYGEDWWCR